MQRNRFALAGALIIAGSFSRIEAKKPEIIWNTGKILDASMVKSQLVTLGSTSASSGTANTIASAQASTFGRTTTVDGQATTTASATTVTQVQHLSISDHQVLIVGLDYEYIVDDKVFGGIGLSLGQALATAAANRKHGCRFIVGNYVIYVEMAKGKLAMIDADGKECYLDIIRQARITPIGAPTGGR